MKQTAPITDLQNAGNALSPAFESTMQEIRASYFSRNPDLWPVFKDPGIAAIGQFRQQRVVMDEAVSAYPDGDLRLEELGHHGYLWC